jgi:hypothetical protein
MIFSQEIMKLSRRAQDEMQRIKGILDNRRVKYRRNLARYMNIRRPAGESLDTLYATFMSSDWTAKNASESNYFSTFNACKACVDTFVSKAALTRVRPYFNSVDGNFTTRKESLAAQHFFDQYYDAKDVYGTVDHATLLATIFDTGVLYIDEDKGSVESIQPWFAYVDPHEYANKRVTKAFLEMPYCPAAELVDYGLTEKESESAPPYQSKVAVYYDLKNGLKFYYVNGVLKKKKDIKFTQSPFLFIHWEKPIKGFFTQSMIDAIYMLQAKLDRNEDWIASAFENGLKHTIITPRGSLKTSTLSNTTAEFWEYDPLPNGAGSPVQVYTPQAIDNQYLARNESLWQKCFEVAGVSQLSATAKKPSGLDSGIAIKTVQDVESERFTLFLKTRNRMYVDIATRCIEIFPEEAELLPDSFSRGIKWGDILKSKNAYKIQFAEADVLSKDPNEKIKQIQFLMQNGFIDAKGAAMFLNIPDVERAMRMANTTEEYIHKIIERCIISDNIEFQPVVNLMELQKTTQMYIQQFDTMGAPSEQIDRLLRLYQKTVMLLTPPAPPLPPADGTPLPNGAAVAGDLMPPTGGENVPALPPAEGMPIQNTTPPETGIGGI